jgi:hypothetical protein
METPAHKKQQALKEQASKEQAVSIVLIETNGNIKTLKTKEIANDTLYKKCGFRVSDDFICRHTWKVTVDGEQMYIAVWAKKTGKANFENKYDFPPPIDKDLFFGTCAVVRITADGTGFLDLTKELWLKVYAQLFGGFEDIGDEDEYSEDELANVDPALLTAHGYLKDDFVVSDKDMLESGEVSPEENEEVIVPAITKKIKAKIVKKKAPVKKSGKKPSAKDEDEEDDEETVDTTQELEEEVYTFSDDD